MKLIVALGVAAATLACGRDSASRRTPSDSTVPDTAAAAAPDTAAARRSAAAVRPALTAALQGRGKDAVEALHSLNPATLVARDAAVRSCMLDRLEARHAPPIALTDTVLSRVLAAYREYWLRALLAEHPAGENESWLLSRLNRSVTAGGQDSAANLDALELTLDALIRARGFHGLLGVTSPLRELMLWKAEADSTYRVELPEGTETVAVVFMGDFASLGWAGFATCDRHHSGGWTKPDKLYAVRSAYDLDSEDFRVSYLAHEAQHFADQRRRPKVERQDELEYRAKLVELAVGSTGGHDLLETFAGNVSDDRSVPHSFANGRVVRDMRARLFSGADGEPDWREVPVERIKTAAADLLREDSRRLARGS